MLNISEMVQGTYVVIMEY